MWIKIIFSFFCNRNPLRICFCFFCSLFCIHQLPWILLICISYYLRLDSLNLLWRWRLSSLLSYQRVFGWFISHWWILILTDRSLLAFFCFYQLKDSTGYGWMFYLIFTLLWSMNGSFTFVLFLLCYLYAVVSITSYSK